MQKKSSQQNNKTTKKKHVAVKCQILPTSFPLIIVRQHVMLMRVCRSNSGIIKRQDGEMLSGAQELPHQHESDKTGKRKEEAGNGFPKIGWESD